MRDTLAKSLTKDKHNRYVAAPVLSWSGETLDLLRGVRQLVEDPLPREVAAELAALKLGARGVDLLFEVWISTKEKTPATGEPPTLQSNADH